MCWQQCPTGKKLDKGIFSILPKYIFGWFKVLDARLAGIRLLLANQPVRMLAIWFVTGHTGHHYDDWTIVVTDLDGGKGFARFRTGVHARNGTGGTTLALIAKADYMVRRLLHDSKVRSTFSTWLGQILIHILILVLQVERQVGGHYRQGSRLR